MKYFLSFVLICIFLFPLSACSSNGSGTESDLLGNGFFTSPPPYKLATPTPLPTHSLAPKPTTGGGGGGSVIVPTPKPITQLSAPLLSLLPEFIIWDKVNNADTYIISFQNQQGFDTPLITNVYSSATAYPIELIPADFVGIVSITASSNNPSISDSLASEPITILNSSLSEYYPSTQTVFITLPTTPDTQSDMKISSNLPTMSIVFAKSFYAKTLTITSSTATKIFLSSVSPSAQLSAESILIDSPLATVFQELSFDCHSLTTNVSSNSFNNNAAISTNTFYILGGKVKLNSANSNIGLISATSITSALDINTPTTLNLSSSAAFSIAVFSSNTFLNLASHSGGSFSDISVRASNVLISNNSAFIKSIDVSASSYNTTILNSSHIDKINNLSNSTVYSKTNAANTNIAFSGVSTKVKSPLFLNGITAVDRQYNQTKNISLSGILEFFDGDNKIVTGVELATSERSINADKTTTLFGTMLDKNVGTNKIVVPNLYLAESFSKEYVMFINPILVNITKSPLSLKQATISTPYNSTTAVIVSNLSLLNTATEDVKLYNGEINAVMESKNAGANKITALYGEILSGAEAKNYCVDTSNITVNVIKAPLYNLDTTLATKYNDGTFSGKISTSSILGVIHGDIVSVDLNRSTAVYDTFLSTTSATALVSLFFTGADSSNYVAPAPFYLSGQVILKNNAAFPIINGVMFILDPVLLEYGICEIVTSTATTLDFSNKFFDYPITKIVAPLFSEFLITIILPDTLNTIFDDAFAYCPLLTEVIVSDSNPYFTLVEGVLYTKDLTKIIFSPHT